MSSQAKRQLQSLLEQRKQDLLYRSLKELDGLIDFASNDYLGFSTEGILSKAIAASRNSDILQYGATGSRLISGNTRWHSYLEDFLADYYQRPAALLFNSGYDANLGLYSALPQKKDLVLFDELCHASIRDGLKMSRGKSETFQHNDLEDLEALLQKSTHSFDQIYVATESIFSMDGDEAPLEALIELKNKYPFEILLDEAHATGMYGEKGTGRVEALNVQDEIFASVHTFGKALGAHGAMVVGEEVVKDFLINFSRPFIFSTALPFESLLAIKTAHDILSNEKHKLKIIKSLVELLHKSLEGYSGFELMDSKSHIQGLIIPGNNKAKSVSENLEAEGIYAKAILYPTVPRAKERIRICLHAFNTEEEVNLLCETIQKSFS